MCCISSYFVIGITVSVWTIVQTSFHIVWVLCGYYFYICKIKPSHHWLVVLYLTYFYSNDCGDITLDSGNLFTVEKIKKDVTHLESNDTDEETVYDIVQTILEKAAFPQESYAARRTHLYFLAFLVFDAIWIVTAFLLFAGTCFQIRKCLSLLFYCPWLFTTACLILLDVVSAVHFGLDILQIHSITTWLKFVGVQNYDDFSDFNSHELSRLIPTVPTITLCVLFCRIFVIWIFNVVNFFQILNVAVMAFQDNLDQKNLRNQRHTGRKSKSRNPADQDFNLDSSASRIRSWQLFYGATETTSTGSSSSGGEKGYNSNNSPGRPRNNLTIAPNIDIQRERTSRQNSVESIDSYEKYTLSTRNVAAGTRTSVSVCNTYYRKYSDVAENIDTGNDNVGAASPLNNQLPWSYFPAHVDGPNRVNRPTSMPVDDYGRIKRIHTPLERAQTVCTKL